MKNGQKVKIKATYRDHSVPGFGCTTSVKGGTVEIEATAYRLDDGTFRFENKYGMDIAVYLSPDGEIQCARPIKSAVIEE